MRFSAVVLSLGLALTAGCSSSEDPGGSDTSASEPSSESSGNDEAAGSSKRDPGLNFRPLLASGPADAGAPKDAPPELQQSFAAMDCRGKPKATDADKSAVACDGERQKYLLGPSVATGVSAAEAVQFEGDWVVAFMVNEETQEDLKSFDQKDDGPTVVVFEKGGLVLDAKGVDQLVQNGRTAIDGEFDKKNAESLAEDLRSVIG